MVSSNSNTLHDVIKADISLGNSGASNCWTRQMKDAFGDLGAMYEHLRVVPPGKRLRVPSCTSPEILGSG